MPFLADRKVDWGFELLDMADSSSSSSISRKRRKTIGSDSQARVSADTGHARWRTQAEQQIYSSKLVDALRRNHSSSASGRAVRDAADRVLAVSAKGKTRWSRAILTGRLRIRLAEINKKHKKVAKPSSNDSRHIKPAVQTKLRPLQRKVRTLSRLIPGCRKVSLPNLLEETTDYIAALEMQVKALAFLSEHLNGGSPGGGGGAGAADS